MLVLVGDRFGAHLASFTGRLHRRLVGPDARQYVESACICHHVTRSPGEHRDRQDAIATEQGNRIEVRSSGRFGVGPIAHRARCHQSRTCVHHIEMCVTARTAEDRLADGCAHRTVQHSPGHRVLTPTAPVVVREQVVTDSAGQDRHAGDQKAADLAGLEIRDLGKWVPGGACAVHRVLGVDAAHQRIHRDHARRALRRSHDFDRGDLGRGGTHGVLDGELEGDRR